ncbi:Charged multivesicular body protein 4b [Heterocephalus glaber]|nr:Charged multivesicular body protein 4b [Heterocephalus glaber]
MKSKKRREKPLAQIDATLSTTEFQREALENAHTNTEVLKNMGHAASFAEEFDEDELMAELEEPEQEELDKNLLEISGPETVPLPNVPSIALPSKPTKKKEEEDENMKELENWAGSI